MIFILIKIILLPLLAPLCVGIIRKVKALIQNRRGANIIQPYFEIWKLFHKDEVISSDASWIFMLAPYIIFGLSSLIMSAIPVAGEFGKLPVFSDFLVVIYILATSTFFLALAGMDIGSAFGGFGSSREMMVASFTEGILVFTLLPIALLSHTTDLVLMATSVSMIPITMYFPVVVAFLGYIIALFSETGRIPFDNPSTHLELTMIHEAMILEYSGKRLALIEWASANKLLFFVLLGVNVFFPIEFSMAISPLSFFIALGISMLKALGMLIIIAIVESSIAKFRLFRLPDLLLTGFLFGVIALIAAII